MKNSYEEIGEIVKSARQRLGVGIRELARRSGVAVSAVSDVEAGKGRLGPVTLRKLSEALPLTEDEHQRLFEAAKLVSSRMKTPGGSASAVGEFDALGQTLLRSFGHVFSLRARDLLQAFGPKSGNCVEGYAVVMRLKDNRWIGYGFNRDEVFMAMSEVDDPLSLPDPARKDFGEQGGVRLRMVNAEPDAERILAESRDLRMKFEELKIYVEFLQHWSRKIEGFLETEVPEVVNVAKLQQLEDSLKALGKR